jgi:flagellar protein FlaG
VAGFTGGGRSEAVEISPLSGISLTAPVDPTPRWQQDAATRQIVSAVQELNKTELFGENRQLQFSRDQNTNRVIIKIKNPKTGETIGQIPPETVLRMVADLPVR